MFDGCNGISVHKYINNFKTEHHTDRFSFLAATGRWLLQELGLTDMRSMRNRLTVWALCICSSFLVPCSHAQESHRAVKGTVVARIANRSFPSLFQAWSPADNLYNEDELVTAARHDLIFHHAGYFGMRWNHENWGLATSFVRESIRRGLKKREALLELNPNVLLIMEIRYRDAHRSFLPENHRWWKRDERGKLVMGWEEGGYIQLDFSNPQYRNHVAERAAAATKSGVVDGIMLDWWNDNTDRLALIKTIRSRIGEHALILANANDRKTPKTASFINGFFMECYRSKTPKDWQRIAETLTWAERHLKKPRINCLETWFHESRADLHLMRATTTLSLTLSDGYCLFSDPNHLPTPDHLHDWYEFWGTDLGKPVSPGNKRQDGSVRREFSKGTAVYNPMGNRAVTIIFSELRKSAATGKVAGRHSVAAGDGDIFIKTQ